jgi:hypothetical protein
MQLSRCISNLSGKFKHVPLRRFKTLLRTEQHGVPFPSEWAAYPAIHILDLKSRLGRDMIRGKPEFNINFLIFSYNLIVF